jgi:hypothetical protein
MDCKIRFVIILQIPQDLKTASKYISPAENEFQNAKSFRLLKAR